jgi:hypothetical protein
MLWKMPFLKFGLVARFAPLLGLPGFKKVRFGRYILQSRLPAVRSDFDLKCTNFPIRTRPPSSSPSFPFSEILVKPRITAKAPQIYHSTIEINSPKVSGCSARFVILRIESGQTRAASPG